MFESMKVIDKLSKNLRGHEILVLSCYERDSEGYILVGGNSVNI